MPEMDGAEATRRIRNGEVSGRSALPVVSLTAYAMEEDRNECLAAGMNDYLSKPLSITSLHAALQKWLPREVEPSPKRCGERSEPDAP